MKNIRYALLMAVSVWSVNTAMAQVPSAKEKDTLTLKEIVVKNTNREIIGYYPNWRIYDRKGMTKPENIFFEKYTILNYSFFNPNAAGEILSSDPHSDHILLEESPTIIEQAHVKGCKVMVSIGGWTFSDNFPGIAADSLKRKKFGQECVRLLRDFKFDGIDIDWEFPGYDGHKGGPADRENFTLLMQEIRDQIDAYGKTIEYKFLLTAAFGTYDDATKMIEWDKVSRILDYCNMMTYDFNGPWSSDANHNSPLYNPSSGLPACVDWVYKRMTERYHVPVEKLNVGMAFYGRTVLFPKKDATIYASNTKLTDTITWALYEGTPQYFSVLTEKNKFNEYWDDSAQVPYLIKKDKSSFVSYDDEKSIRMKAEYVVEKNLAGVIIWEITGDYLETSPGSGVVGKTPLIDVVNKVFDTRLRRKSIKRKG